MDDTEDDIATQEVDFRHSHIYFSGNFGKVTLGQAAMAGNGRMWSAYNGAWAGTEFGTDSNSGISVNAADGSTSGLVGSYFWSTPLAPGRGNILRYDSPSIGPIAVEVSFSKDGKDDHAWNFGGSLATEFGGGSVKGGLVYAEDVLGMAGGIQFSQGSSVNLAWGKDDVGNRDYETVYASVAHSWGDTSVALGYQTVSNGNGQDAQAIGLGVNQSLGSGVDVYAGFNNYTFDDATDRDLEDVNAFHIGSMVSFN
jgi:hypothetical protein